MKPTGRVETNDIYIVTLCFTIAAFNPSKPCDADAIFQVIAMSKRTYCTKLQDRCIRNQCKVWSTYGTISK